MGNETVFIGQVNSELLEMVLKEFCFCGKISAPFTLEILEIADQFLMPSLVSYCISQMIRLTTFDTLLDFLQFAESYSLPELKWACFQFIIRNLHEIIEQNFLTSLTDLQIQHLHEEINFQTRKFGHKPHPYDFPFDPVVYSENPNLKIIKEWKKTIKEINRIVLLEEKQSQGEELSLESHFRPYEKPFIIAKSLDVQNMLLFPDLIDPAEKQYSTMPQAEGFEQESRLNAKISDQTSELGNDLKKPRRRRGSKSKSNPEFESDTQLNKQNSNQVISCVSGLNNKLGQTNENQNSASDQKSPEPQSRNLPQKSQNRTYSNQKLISNQSQKPISNQPISNQNLNQKSNQKLQTNSQECQHTEPNERKINESRPKINRKKFPKPKQEKKRPEKRSSRQTDESACTNEHLREDEQIRENEPKREKEQKHQSDSNEKPQFSWNKIGVTTQISFEEILQEEQQKTPQKKQPKTNAISIPQRKTGTNPWNIPHQKPKSPGSFSKSPGSFSKSPNSLKSDNLISKSPSSWKSISESPAYSFHEILQEQKEQKKKVVARPLDEIIKEEMLEKDYLLALELQKQEQGFFK